MDLKVKKRNGDYEKFDAEKINKILIWATEGIQNVSPSDIAMNAEYQFNDKIDTKIIHEILIQSTVDLISEELPNYQYVASNLLNYLLRKEVFETKDKMPSLWDVINKNINIGVYDSIILEKYTKDEIEYIDTFIKHERDYHYTYAGLKQLIDKYLVKDRTTNTTFETPQFAIIVLSMVVFSEYDHKERFKHIKNLYELISNMQISLSTPVMAGIRTPNRQYSSCTLISVDDSLDSIFNANTAIGMYVAKRAGIGIDAGRIRALGSKIRNGEVVHTGVIPFFKMFQSTLHSCSQGGIRKGSGTLYFPFWHLEIEDVLVLKNNKGTDDNRVRHIDYAIQFCRLFYQRVVNNEDITLFSPDEVHGLYDSFGYNDEFEKLYLKYENDPNIRKKKISAKELMLAFAKERIETGRMYVMNIDNVNSNSPFQERISMSNLCLTGDTWINSVLINDNLYEKLRLDELVELFEYKKDASFKVLSKNIETNSYEFKTIEKAWLTKENADDLYEIEDEETGYKIKCTGDHLIFTKNRGYIRADELIETDVLDILQ